jgi:hypothetical protein
MSVATASYVDFGNIDNKPTLVSSSAQIATDISGAFDEVSSSLSSRIFTLETQDIYSGSFSGSFVGDGSGLTNITSTLPQGVLSSSVLISTDCY